MESRFLCLPHPPEMKIQRSYPKLNKPEVLGVHQPFRFQNIPRLNVMVQRVLPLLHRIQNIGQLVVLLPCDNSRCPNQLDHIDQTALSQGQ